MTHRHNVWALRAAVICAGLALWPGQAHAGEAVKLLVELPPDVQVVGPGDSVPVQVVGEDAAGNRSAFGRRKVVFSVGRGRIEVVERPYRFSYRAPDTIGSAQTIRVKAHLEETPAVQGFTTIRIAPPGRYVRLLLRPATTSVKVGGETTIEVLAEKRAGGTTPLVDQRVNLAVSGGGSVEFVRLGHYRYRAPTRAEGGAPGQQIRLSATLENQARVKGEALLTLLARRGPPPVTPPNVKPPPAAPPERPGGGNDDGNDGATEDPAGTPAGVTWPGGNIRVALWRAREAGAEWSAAKRLPKAGGEFLALAPFQKLRVVVERSDAVKVELEWWVGGKNGATIRRDGPGEQGALNVVRRKDGLYVAHLVGHTPESRKPLHIDLLITLTSGKILRESIVMRRGVDADRDGVRDGARRR